MLRRSLVVVRYVVAIVCCFVVRCPLCVVGCAFVVACCVQADNVVSCVA